MIKRSCRITMPFLYVLLLHDGGIKFGITNRPRMRFITINRTRPVKVAHVVGRVLCEGTKSAAERFCWASARESGWRPRVSTKPAPASLIEVFDGGSFAEGIHIARTARDTYARKFISGRSL